MGLCNRQPGSSSVYMPAPPLRISFYIVGGTDRETSVAGKIVILVYFIIYSQGTTPPN